MPGICGLAKIELPDATVLLTDGGFMPFEGDTYKGADPTFGTIASLEPMAEGVGDEVPALDMELLPPGTAAVADLSQPGFQKSRARFWIGEFDVDTGQIVGTPDLLFDGQIDQTTLRVGASRSLAMSIVSTAERLFERNIGNSLSPVFHKSVWPGELGHDNATGLSVPVAWGVESPRRGTGGAGGGGRGGVDGGSGRYREAY